LQVWVAVVAVDVSVVGVLGYYLFFLVAVQTLTVLRVSGLAVARMATRKLREWTRLTGKGSRVWMVWCGLPKAVLRGDSLRPCVLREEQPWGDK
jgi:hypothetical protein